MSDKVWFMGNEFDSLKDFLESEKKYADCPISEERFNYYFDRLKKDIWFNIEIEENIIRPMDLMELIEDLFLFTIRRIRKGFMPLPCSALVSEDSLSGDVPRVP